MTRILVTGGAGFIGSAVCRHLVGETDAQVLNLDKLTYAGNIESLPSIAGTPRYRHVACDVTSAAGLDGIVAAFAPETVLSEPYVENDAIGPTGVYGHSKLQGKQAVMAAHRDHAILRIAWVYSPWGYNFVWTMLRLAQTRQEVAVVNDQHGNPTAAEAIAEGILAVGGNLVRNRTSPDMHGIFHMTADGEATWADFAAAIFNDRAARGGPSVNVKRISSDQYPTAAKRRSNSPLNHRRIAEIHNVRQPHWRDSLGLCLDRLSSN